MWRGIWNMAQTVATDFVDDDVMTNAAALALYCALGLAPTVLLILAVTSWLGPEAEKAVIGQVESMVGGQAAQGVADVVKSAKQGQAQKASGTVSAIVGLVTLAFSVSGIFAQLQSSLDRIWEVEPKPQSAIWGWLRSRLLSFGALLSVLFLLLVSLVVNAAITLVFGPVNHWSTLDAAVSLAIYVLLFALIFKILPNARIQWRDVWIGAAATAILFAVGRYAIGLYLGHSAVASSYGAAGSLVALIVWVYYSAIIVLLGAEITQAYARRFGGGIRPDEHAVDKHATS